MVLLALAVLLLQSTLYQLPQTRLLRAIRILLLPACLSIVWTTTGPVLEPAREQIAANIGIQFARAAACLRSIEMATARQQCRWIGLDAAYGARKASTPVVVRPQPIDLLSAVRNGAANLMTQCA